MNSMKWQKDELPRLVGAQNATRDQWRNNSRENKEVESKQKQHPVVDIMGDGSKVQHCKEQYCIETWNVRSMIQCKLEVVKEEMARVNVDILGISVLFIIGYWNAKVGSQETPGVTGKFGLGVQNEAGQG